MLTFWRQCWWGILRLIQIFRLTFCRLDDCCIDLAVIWKEVFAFKVCIGVCYFFDVTIGIIYLNNLDSINCLVINSTSFWYFTSGIVHWIDKCIVTIVCAIRRSLLASIFLWALLGSRQENACLMISRIGHISNSIEQQIEWSLLLSPSTLDYP